MSALDALLAAGRAAHEELMLDTVRLVRPGQPVYDPATGATTTPGPRVLYAGKARTKPVLHSRDAVAGERLVVKHRYEVALPWSALPPDTDRVLPGDQVVVDASPDPRLTGMVLWVESVAESATATAWRISAEDRS